jgi:protein-disulfide isomerase
MSRRTYLTVGGLAGLLAAALIAASVFGARGGQSASAEEPSGTDAATLLQGIPQSGSTLGRPAAPVTLVEFADLQCPYCAQWSQQAFAEIVRDYVRPGKVRIVFGGLAFIGPDSEQALRFAAAAGRQGKLWHVVDLLYANQGAENSGWANEELLREVGAAVPGLRVEQALGETSSPAVDRQLAAAHDLSTRLGVRGTPAFAAAKTGAPLAPIRVTSLGADGLRPTLDRLLEP